MCAQIKIGELTTIMGVKGNRIIGASSEHHAHFFSDGQWIREGRAYQSLFWGYLYI